MNTELFLPFAESQKLKELGFKDKTFGYYSHEGFLLITDLSYTDYIRAPLLQQAIDWLDITHNIRVETFTSQVVGKYSVQLYVPAADRNNGVIWDRVPLIGKSGFTRRDAIINGINEAIKILEK